MAEENKKEKLEELDEASLQNVETETTEPEEPVEDHVRIEPAPPKKLSMGKRILGFYTHKKKLAIPLTLIILVAIPLAIPVSRYATLGLVIKRDIQVKLLDAQTNAPISGADVSAGGKTAKTDAAGLAIIKGVKVGKTKLVATKKYYKDSSIGLTVTLKKVTSSGELRLEATGRQVPVHVINKITGADIAGATIKAADTEVTTDKNGIATIVLPANQPTLAGTVIAKDYNNLTIQITVNQSATKENTFAITPGGKLYFLSKQTGKIDVVKTDLDGSNRQTVLAGTGQEEDTNTVLLASRDWKYLALQSRRESDKPRLYLLDTATDKLSEIDSGDATFTPVGWHDHTFVYKVNRAGVLNWQPKAIALKVFNAENQQLSTVEETNAEGSSVNDFANEQLDNVTILKDAIIYTKSWSANYYSAFRLAGKRSGIYGVKPNGTAKQVLKDFDSGTYTYISALPYKPTEVYFSVNSNGRTDYYEYEAGVIKENKELNGETFSKFYATYLASPSGQGTFWYEPRDGKNTLFTGTTDGSNPKQIASLSEYTPYGWYSDSYLLVSKGGSELFIMPATGVDVKTPILKVTDYHKPNVSFRGYGYGYGGF